MGNRLWKRILFFMAILIIPYLAFIPLNFYGYYLSHGILWAIFMSFFFVFGFWRIGFLRIEGWKWLFFFFYMGAWKAFGLGFWLCILTSLLCVKFGYLWFKNKPKFC